jgi:hypothetical protein
MRLALVVIALFALLAAPAAAHDDAPDGALTHMDTRAELADVNIAATAVRRRAHDGRHRPRRAAAQLPPLQDRLRPRGRPARPLRRLA